MGLKIIPQDQTACAPLLFAFCILHFFILAGYLVNYSPRSTNHCPRVLLIACYNKSNEHVFTYNAVVQFLQNCTPL